VNDIAASTASDRTSPLHGTATRGISTFIVVLIALAVFIRRWDVRSARCSREN
jgi:hypothetical protein